MRKYPDKALRELSKHLHVDMDIFMQSVEESVIEIQEVDGRLDLCNGTALRLRKLERICETFDMDVPAALLLLDLVQRIADLQEEVEMLRTASASGTKKPGLGTFD